MNARRIVLPMALAAFGLASTVCAPGSATDDGATLKAAVTIYATEFFTREVGGDRVRITALLPTGTDAHDFEPTPGDIRTITESDIVVFNHPAFEGWMVDAMAVGGSSVEFVQLANLPDDVEFQEEGGAADPHVWLNPAQAIDMVNKVRDALSRLDPDGASYYEANASALVGRLMDLDATYQSGLQNCEQSVFVASHLAYGHLAERYGLEQIGLSGLSDEAESSPQHIAEIVEQIRTLGLSVILVEPFSNQALAETVARETGAQLLPLHPLESLTRTEQDLGDDYFAVMERNLVSLRTALNCAV